MFFLISFISFHLLNYLMPQFFILLHIELLTLTNLNLLLLIRSSHFAVFKRLKSTFAFLHQTMIDLSRLSVIYFDLMTAKPDNIELFRISTLFYLEECGYDPKLLVPLFIF